jgi:hypothetical protein
MNSRFITPPDHLPTEKNILIINALDTQLATLALWLKTVSDCYDIHLYHSQMPSSNWIIDVIAQADRILVSKPEIPALSLAVQELLDANNQRIVYFGTNTDYPDLIQYFLINRSELV